MSSEDSLEKSNSCCGILKKFKNWIALITVPLLLLVIFAFVDEKKTVCTPPCTYFKDFKSRANCEKAHKYASTFCVPRCMDECFNNFVTLAELEGVDPKLEISKKQDCLDAYKKWNVNDKPMLPINWADDNTTDLFMQVVNLKRTEQCFTSYDEKVVDAMDYTNGDADIKFQYNSIFNYKKAACMYGASIMIVFYVFEVIPLTVTSIMPLFMFPMLGVQTSKIVAGFFFTHIIALFYGGLLVANAIEKVNLHRRLALFVLTLVGPQPKLILLAFMCITSFISMWVSNVATTIMVLPIAVSVIEELKRNLDEKARSVGYNSDNEGEENQKLLEDAKQADCDDETARDYRKKYETQENIKKALIMAICYCASIGGTGMIMGTGPNAIFAGSVPTSAGVAVSSYAIFAFPTCWIMTLIAWGVLWFFFLRTCQKQTEEELDSVKEVILKQYNDLGSMKFGEKVVGLITLLMATLWISRKLSDDVWGWNDIPGLNTRDVKGNFYINDSMVAIFMLFLLFVLPVDMPSLNANEALPKPILEFKAANAKLAWSVLFILGGGFAMANGIVVSGLATWLGTKLAFLKTMPVFVVVAFACGLITVMTQACANSATTSIFMPVLLSIAEARGINPLIVMAPCTLCVSYAFMLPVSTPPNVMCMAYGLESKDLLKVGSVLVLIGPIVVIAWTFMAGSLAFPDINDPCAEWLLNWDSFNAPASCLQAPITEMAQNLTEALL